MQCKIVVVSSTMPMNTGKTMRQVPLSALFAVGCLIFNLCAARALALTLLPHLHHLHHPRSLFSRKHAFNPQVFQAANTVKHEVLCFPAFYRGGTDVQELANPSTVLLGSDDTKSGAMAFSVFTNFLKPWIATERALPEDFTM